VLKIANTYFVAAALAASIWLSFAAPSQGQLASYVDEHGKLIYINSNSPETGRGSTISPPGADLRNSSAAGYVSSAPKFDGVPVSLMNRSASAPAKLDRIVSEAAQRHQVDPALVKAVISTESGWNPQAVSRKGAVGLMQLIPATAQRYGVGDSFDPVQNVEGGTTYLKWLLDRYHGDLSKSLAAYNAGERAVDQSGGVPAYRETQRYVQKVTNAYFQPDSGRDTQLWSAPERPVRRETDSNGRVVFTNE
jgi:soluble lytic murein transglycosylase-like protein